MYSKLIIIIIALIWGIYSGIDTFKTHKGTRVKIGYEYMDKYTGSFMAAMGTIVVISFTGYFLLWIGSLILKFFI